jgi:hypothetical protein
MRKDFGLVLAAAARLGLSMARDRSGRSNQFRESRVREWGRLSTVFRRME